VNPLSSLRQLVGRFIPGRSRRSYDQSGGYVPAAPVLSGTFITPETALGVAAVFSAINVIARDIAVLPLQVYRRLPNNGREIETGGQLGELNELLNVAPNEDLDAFRWKRDKMGHVLGRGNGYSEIVRKNGFPVRLELLHPAKTIPKRASNTPGGRVGKLFYQLENERRLDPDNCLHWAGLGFNGLVGFSPLTLMRQTIGIAMAAEQFGASLFGNGAFTSGWLKVARHMGEAALHNLRKTFNDIHQGPQSAHLIGILEEGMEFQPNQINPEDAQMIATREFSVKDIARIFAIPPHKIGDYSESHLANVEEANLDYVSMTLMGWVAMIESQCNVKLLTREQRRTHFIAMDMTRYLRGNIQAQMLRIQTLRNVGAFSADDVRVDQGLNPLPSGVGGDKYVVQSQYTTLDQIGKVPPVSRPAGPPEEKSMYERLGLILLSNGYHHG